MTRREQGLVIAAGLVAVVGLVSLLGGGKPTAVPPRAPAEVAQAAAVTRLAKTLRQAAPTPVDQALLAAVQQPWRLSAVYDKSLKLGRQTTPGTRHHYTGYVELGSGRLAVVDGYEYQVGDTLEGGGFKVVRITPAQVCLERLATGDREDVPYEGQDALAR